jgi:tRNA (cmo5U34)-methyltransferase
MTERSIAAYDVLQRVKTYDADMELMHPNRSKMVQIAIEMLPFPKTAALRAIDLGIGTGYFTERFLNHFPNSRVLGIDGAQSMIELAKERLTLLALRLELVIGDFRKLQELAPGAGTVDAVFSAYALHHLSRSDKEAVLRQVVELLVPGGWFVNADLFSPIHRSWRDVYRKSVSLELWNAHMARTTDSVTQHRRGNSWLIWNVRKLINHSPLLRI